VCALHRAIRLSIIVGDGNAKLGRARIIKLTKRGHVPDAAVWTAGREVEQSWRNRFAAKQWTTFNEVLEKLIVTAD